MGQTKTIVTQENELTTVQAPGKIILFGEHAVVYGRPALAVPIRAVQATATVTNRTEAGVLIRALDLQRTFTLDEVTDADPLALIVRLVLDRLKIREARLDIAVTSTIPMAGGLGSGAAVSVAIARALGRHFGNELTATEISDLAFEVERVHHGTPSGIDNTVIAHERAIIFRKGHDWQALSIVKPFRIAIADTGIPSPTRLTVGDVRRAWEADRETVEVHFDNIADVVARARKALEQGEPEKLGELMDENQKELQALGVSDESNERLIKAAKGAGAAGAKLSGGGRGGNIIALIDSTTSARVTAALKAAGVKKVLVTEIK